MTQVSGKLQSEILGRTDVLHTLSKHHLMKYLSSSHTNKPVKSWLVVA
jgi:hypothetical protein